MSDKLMYAVGPMTRSKVKVKEFTSVHVITYEWPFIVTDETSHNNQSTVRDSRNAQGSTQPLNLSGTAIYKLLINTLDIGY